MRSRNRGRLHAGLLMLLVALAAVLLAACGGGSSTESSSSGGSTEASTGAEEGGGADVAAAEEILAPYTGKYSPGLPVDEPLKEKPSSSIRVSMLQLAQPIGALVTELAGEAAKTAGVQFEAVKAGTSASTAQSAMETVVTKNPDGLILPPFEPTTIAPQLATLNENGTYIVGNGIIDGEKFGIQGNLSPRAAYERIGAVFAAWAVAKHGADTDALLIEHPELSFSPVLKEAFEEEMEELCPECKTSTVAIPGEEVSTASRKIVSELQANPDINQILAISDFTSGLPAAMKSAGLDVGTFVYPGDPQSFEYIKNGELEAAFATSNPIEFYTAVDMVLRSAQGTEITTGEEEGLMPAQILTEEDMTFDLGKGWEPVPNFVEKFEEFWHVK